MLSAAEFFVSNPCRNNPIHVFYFPYTRATIKYVPVDELPFVLCDYEINDNNTVTYIEAVSSESNETFDLQLSDNNYLVNFLTEIEANPQLSTNCLLSLMEKYHLGIHDNRYTCECISEQQLRGIVIEIYLLFVCYKTLIWEIPFDIIDDIWKQRLYETVELFTSTESMTPQELCTKFLEHITQAELYCKQEVYFNEEKIQRYSTCDTVYDALTYQIMLHIEYGKKGLNGYVMAECKRCGNLYSQKNKRFELCNICRQPNERLKACRAKKRKEAANAQESNP